MSQRSIPLTEETLAHPAPKATLLDAVAEQIEEEIHRLRRLRPALDSRIDKAAGIIVMHLACPRSRTIRVRFGANGKPRFLVSGSAGAVYVVEPDSWSCTCPDHHRNGDRFGICKHGIACYLLIRAVPGKRTRAKAKPCAGCGKPFPPRELVEVQEWHESMFFEGDTVCAGCALEGGVL
jgi:hypothetical protein